MDNSKLNADRPEKELNTELLKVMKEFGDVEIKIMQFSEAIATAENLGLTGDVYMAQLKLMFIKQKAFYLQLRYIRTLNLLMQKNRNFGLN